MELACRLPCMGPSLPPPCPRLFIQSLFLPPMPSALSRPSNSRTASNCTPFRRASHNPSVSKASRVPGFSGASQNPGVWRVSHVSGFWRGPGNSGVCRALCCVYGVREWVGESGRRVVPYVWSNRSARGLVWRIWATGGEKPGGPHADRNGSGQAHSVKRWRPLNPTGDTTEQVLAVGGPKSWEGRNSNPGSLEEEQSGDDPARVRVRTTFDKSGSKYEVSKSADTKVYSSSRMQRLNKRSYTSSSQTNTSVALQGIAGTNTRTDRQEHKMQKGRSQKRPAPSDQHADEHKPKRKKDPAESGLRRSLDMCSKHADAMQALEIYDKVVSEGTIVFNQYNYNILLYLCSSAATDSLKRGKSGNEKLKSSGQGKQTGGPQEELDGTGGTEPKAGAEAATDISEAIVLTDEQKELCMKRGFEIYEAMKLQGVPPNEATFTAVARLAVAKEDGDLAFDMVKQMAEAKLAPRLRSYGPALYTYCKLKVVDKAFEVDDHMRAAGVRLEESELEALLKLSVDMGLEDKVYSLLHRLRTTVRELSPSTAKVIEQWFKSDNAASAGRSNWETLPGPKTVRAATESCGGGWHGLGWLGKGAWEVKPSILDKAGLCRECGEQLVTIDIDPQETEMFAESLSTLACQREAKNNEFKKFQAWLDRHGPYDVIVDGANVGLYNQNFGDGGFNFYQLNSVVKGIQQKLGSKKEPLILLHHRRTKGGAAASSFAINTLNRWQEANSIYTTPTGSNDDWYWLYAAVRYKCMLVTNDEMRDHLFQLLGNDFFPKWKERHQVRFTLSKEGPVFHMPPPYSILIQESEKGSWHIPTSGGDDISAPREWLCVTRSGHVVLQDLKSEENSKSCSSSVPEVDSSECKPLMEASTELKELSISVQEVPSPKKPRSPKSSPKSPKSSPKSPKSLPKSPKSLTHEVLGAEDLQDQPTSPKKVQSPTRNSRLPKSPTTLQRLKVAEKSSSKSPIDFQI